MSARKIPLRLAVFGAALLLLLFFSNDFGLIDIQKTSIVTAVAIDAGEEGIDVTVQIAVPKSGSTAASNVTVKDAATMMDAIAELNLKTGWYPTLVHCRLILLGEEAAKDNVFDHIDYFLRSQFVEDTCLVALCRGRAEKALSAQSPVGDMTYAAIEKVLSSEAQQTGLVSVNILREFSKGYFGAGESSFLPLLTVREDAETGGSDADSGDANAGGSGGAGSSGGKAVFEASETALFLRGKQVATLGAEETLAFNLADTDTDLAYGNVTVTERGKPVIYSLKMRIGKKSLKVRAEGEIPVLCFSIRARAQVADVNRAGSAHEVAQSSIVPESVLRAAEETFRARLSDAFSKAQESGCDLFGVCASLQRFYPKLWKKLGKEALAQTKPVYDIQFDTMH